MQPLLSLPCPNCGTDLTFLDQYQRHFCHRCQQYAPEGYGARGAKKCPTCSGILSHVAVYDRYFCYRCQQYSPPESAQADASQGVDAAPNEPAARDEASTPGATAGETPPAERPDEDTSADRGEADAPEEEEEELIVVERPPLSRMLIETAKKSMLVDLSKAYGLDPGGTKEELRERLLHYLEEEEATARPAEPETMPDETPPETEGPVEPEPSLEGQEYAADEPTVTPEPEPEAIESPEEPPVERAPEPVPPRPTEAAATVPAVPVTVPTEIREAGTTWPIGPATPSAVARAEHPCPRCGRELDHIAQYDRWYCHYCKTYAPKQAFKHACPTCGSTLRWIERYDRWWCDAEQKYAPSDLPSPPGGAQAVATAAVPAFEATTVTQTVARSAVEVHRHRSPGTGIGVAAFGLFLWLMYQLVVAIPVAFAIPPPVTISADVAFALQFLGMLLLGAGVIVGLAALRDRR